MTIKTVITFLILVILAAVLGLGVYIVAQNWQKSKPDIPSLQNLTEELDSALQGSAS